MDSSTAESYIPLLSPKVTGIGPGTQQVLSVSEYLNNYFYKIAYNILAAVWLSKKKTHFFH